jgi:hypothetical protein
MTYNNKTPPIAISFKCENNGCIGTFWSIFPDVFYREPDRKMRGNTQKLDSTAQCPKCQTVNTVYWYTPKIF